MQSQSHCTNKLGRQIKFLPIFIQNLLFCGECSSSKKCPTNVLQIFIQKWCFVQSQSHCNKKLGRQITFLPIFIQNMLLFCVEWSSSKTWCYKFLPVFIQNMICFVQSQSHCNNKPGSTDLHPKHVVLCREWFSSKNVVLCIVIFIQNMFFCA